MLRRHERRRNPRMRLQHPAQRRQQRLVPAHRIRRRQHHHVTFLPPHLHVHPRTRPTRRQLRPELLQLPPLPTELDPVLAVPQVRHDEPAGGTKGPHQFTHESEVRVAQVRRDPPRAVVRVQQHQIKSPDALVLIKELRGVLDDQPERRLLQHGPIAAAGLIHGGFVEGVEGVFRGDFLKLDAHEIRGGVGDVPLNLHAQHVQGRKGVAQERGQGPRAETHAQHPRLPGVT